MHFAAESGLSTDISKFGDNCIIRRLDNETGLDSSGKDDVCLVAVLAIDIRVKEGDDIVFLTRVYDTVGKSLARLDCFRLLGRWFLSRLLLGIRTDCGKVHFRKVVKEPGLLVLEHLEEGVTDAVQGFEPFLCGGRIDCALGGPFLEDIFLLVVNDAGDDLGRRVDPGPHLLDDFIDGVPLGFDQPVYVVGEKVVQAAFVQREQAVPVAAVAVTDDDVAIYLSQTVTGLCSEHIDIVFDAYVLALNLSQDELAGEFLALLLQDARHIDVVVDFLVHGSIRFLQ